MHEGHRLRLRKRFLKEGLSSFAEHEVLEFVLFFSIPRIDTNALAHELINSFGSFKNVLEADYHELLKIKGIGDNSATLIKLLPELAKYYYMSKQDQTKLTTIADACNYMVNLSFGAKNEKFFVICLDMRFNIIHQELVVEGTIDSIPMYTRNIASVALKCNASQIIISHNHPTGNPRPSVNDIECTKKIMQALEPINIRLIDHIITSNNDYYSFAAQRMLLQDMPSDRAYATQYISTEKE